MFRGAIILVILSLMVVFCRTCFGPKNCGSSASADQKILITCPCPDTTVSALQSVEGTVSGPGVKEVWVVIHPMETADYWIQQRATVADGKWEVICHFGEPEQHQGNPYEFLAIADPKEPVIDENGKLKILD